MFPRFPFNKNLVKQLVLSLAVCATALWIVARRDVPRAEAQTQQPDYKSFEGPQVHPLAITPDGMRLLAVNTPNNTLSVFYLSGGALTLVKEIPVGLEPVSVAVRNEREAWVANWLSDTVSVVDLANGNVVQTIDVGDEPTDVLFAGVSREMAFVCVSGLSQVKVFDPNSTSTAPQVISIRGKQPRSLTRDPSGAQVFVSVFESGNQTTVVPTQQVRNEGPPQPIPNGPITALIVKRSGANWVDDTGNGRWTRYIPYTLADVDVVMIDAGGTTPSISREVRGVGTLIGNSTLDPIQNRLYVVNTEAHNEVRFEPILRGRFSSTRVSIINLGANASVTPVDLNPHIDLSNPSGTDEERSKSLALPADIARDANGTLYVAATGSNRLGVLDSSGAVQARISVGQGPTGLAVDNARSRLYVLNRFDETLSVVDLSSRNVINNVSLGNNPEPAVVRNGRRFLYDASLSAHGDLACASCHANGHRDGLAWDLGDPQGKIQQAPSGNFPLFPNSFTATFFPMKGPMMTQSLRGIIGTEPLHWRGDRASFADFNPAFMSLLGGTRQLTSDEMSAFESFIRTLTYPPNPLENLDRTQPSSTTGPNAARGEQVFNTGRIDGGLVTCNQCHTASLGFKPGTLQVIIPAQLTLESQDLKVPQLRGLYQKVGMQQAPGEQLSGFGFTHDGSIDSLNSFLHSLVFLFQRDSDRVDLAQFLLSFDTGTAPAVGLQVTANALNKTSAAVSDRINLLMSQAGVGNCDLIVRGTYQGARRGFLYVGNGLFQPDRLSDAPVSMQTLLQAVDVNQELTFTGVPVGAGRRAGIDADGNGVLNGDEASRPNPIDDTRFFIQQQYADFLNRDPDPPGFQGWTNILTNCGVSVQQPCDRIEVSSDFFRSPEFQGRGYFVFRFYIASLGRNAFYKEFMPDLRRVSGFLDDNQLEAARVAFVNEFVTRLEFKQKYDAVTDPTAYVDAILTTAGVTLSQRQQLINDLSSGKATRASTLRAIMESQEVYDKYYNTAFVVMQYFGYLRRDPDILYLDWIKIMDRTGDYRTMINGFMNSVEYRQRFKQ